MYVRGDDADICFLKWEADYYECASYIVSKRSISFFDILATPTNKLWFPKYVGRTTQPIPLGIDRHIDCSQYVCRDIMYLNYPFSLPNYSFITIFYLLFN